jgi:hypothetical protein
MRVLAISLSSRRIDLFPDDGHTNERHNFPTVDHSFLLEPGTGSLINTGSLYRYCTGTVAYQVPVATVPVPGTVLYRSLPV